MDYSINFYSVTLYLLWVLNFHFPDIVVTLRTLNIIKEELLVIAIENVEAMNKSNTNSYLEVYSLNL